MAERECGMSLMCEKAMRIAKRVHAGQKDKAGAEYYLHPFHVASQVKTEEEKIVAYLHDVVEDSEVSLEDLKKEGFSERVVAAIDAISKRKGEEYDLYLQRVAKNRLASTVKLADLRHNADVTRYVAPTRQDIERSHKYEERIRVFREYCAVFEGF